MRLILTVCRHLQEIEKHRIKSGKSRVTLTDCRSLQKVKTPGTELGELVLPLWISVYSAFTYTQFLCCGCWSEIALGKLWVQSQLTMSVSVSNKLNVFPQKRTTHLSTNEAKHRLSRQAFQKLPWTSREVASHVGWACISWSDHLCHLSTIYRLVSG